MIESNQSRSGIAVVGLGFIGLPLALSYAMKGFRVVGIDVNPLLVDALNRGETSSKEKDGERTAQEILREQVAAGRFRATTDYREAAGEVSSYIVTVGVPVVQGEPDFTFLDGAIHSLADVLQKDDLLLIRSTVVPGTTKERIIPALAQKGWIAEENLYVAYCSERIAEGRAFEEFRHMPLALGAAGPKSLQRAHELMAQVCEAPIYHTDMTVVEAAKVVENVQRDVNIALVQEIARFCQAAGIDTHELIRIANTHTRVNLLYPGPGVGGYCLPNAFYYLEAAARSHDVQLPLMRLSRETNDDVPRHIVKRVQDALLLQGKGLRGAKVAVFGLAMKDHSNDTRISPSLEIVRLLLEKGAQVYAYDPQVGLDADFVREDPQECLEEADAFFLLCWQPQYERLDFAELLARMKRPAVIFDGKQKVDAALCQSWGHILLHI